MLYRLCGELTSRGLDACIFIYGRRRRGDEMPAVRVVQKFTDDMRENAVVVYPEIIWGNPLGARHVARWVLNRPALRGGSLRFSPDELVFSWSRQYYPSPHLLRLDVIDRDLFYDAGERRTTDAVFVYKGGRVRETPELDGLPVITMDYPASREELAALLRRTRILYTHDLHTALADEADACGAKVKVITPDGFDLWKPGSEAYDPSASAHQLAEFIRLTQHDEGSRNCCTRGARRPFLPLCYAKWCCARLLQLCRVGSFADRLRMRAVQDIFLR